MANATYRCNMKYSRQFGMADHLLNLRRKQDKMLTKLSKNDDLVSWKQIISQIKVIGKNRSGEWGSPIESDVDAHEITTLKDSNLKFIISLYG